MTSSNWKKFRVTGPRGEFTGHRWIPRTKPVTRSFDVFFDLRLNEWLSEAGDLRRHRAHYDVTMMWSEISPATTAEPWSICRRTIFFFGGIFIAVTLIQCGQVTHICVSKLGSLVHMAIDSYNGLLGVWHQAINWTITGVSLIGPLATKFSEIRITTQYLSYKNI